MLFQDVLNHFIDQMNSEQGSHRPAADSAPGVATWEVISSAQKVVPCVRWPATGITALSL